MHKNKIFILILNYNGFADTVKCLKTLYKVKSKRYYLFTIIIDNGSKAEELQKIKSFFNDPENLKNYHLDKIKLIENKKNLGFAKGNNIGIRYALTHGASYILLLNNDTKIEMNFLEKLIEIDPAIASPVVKFREFRHSPKLMYDLGGFVNWTTGRTWHVNAYAEEFHHFQNRQPLEADYVAGCCLLVKREVFEKIGLLDEKYFIYFEDVDFCVTAKKKGYRVIVDPSSVIYHKLGGSMDRWSKRAIFHNLFSNFIFITKHLGLRRITGYSYLFILTLKIIKDRIWESLLPYPGDSYIMKKKKWTGAHHNLKA